MGSRKLLSVLRAKFYYETVASKICIPRGDRLDKETDEEVAVTLPVHKSAISSVDKGIARLHSSHMDMFEEDEDRMVLLKNGKKKIVVKLVSDRFARKDMIILRSGDMDDLDVKEGDLVKIEPYHKMTDEIKESWKMFVKKFKREEEDEEEGGN